MAKDKIAFVCSNCGQESPKWIGKCPNCGQWNTFKEFRIAADTGSQAARNAATTLRNAASGGSVSALANKPQRLRDISSHDDPRIDMHDGELNRVSCGVLSVVSAYSYQYQVRHQVVRYYLVPSLHLTHG